MLLSALVTLRIPFSWSLNVLSSFLDMSFSWVVKLKLFYVHVRTEFYFDFISVTIVFVIKVENI